MPDDQLPLDFGGSKPRARRVKRVQPPAQPQPIAPTEEEPPSPPLQGAPKDQQNHGRLWNSLRGRPVQPRPKTMLRDLFGRGARKNSADTAAAAKELDVSRGTVQRWIRNGKLPERGRSAAADRVRDLWEASPAGRKRTVDPAMRKAFYAGHPISGRVKAKVTVSGGDSRRNSARSFNFDLDPQAAAAVMDALMDGDPEATSNAFIDGVAGGFGGSLDLEIDHIIWK